jgi:hypothetical protein
VHAESGAVGREVGGQFDAGGVEGVGDETEEMFPVFRGWRANMVQDEKEVARSLKREGRQREDRVAPGESRDLRL